MPLSCTQAPMASYSPLWIIRESCYNVFFRYLATAR
jgi:hypothetical protein